MVTTRVSQFRAALKYNSYLIAACALLLTLGLTYGIFGAVLSHDPSGRTLEDVFRLWDAEWYLSIIQNGYFYEPGAESSVVFFPAYPLLVRVFSRVISNEIAAAVIVNLACYLGGLILLYRISADMVGSAAARRTVLYLALFPVAFFFTLVYTEAIFFVLSTACVYLARKRAWWAASVCGAAVTATRLIGLLVWMIIFFEWLKSQGLSFREGVTREGWRRIWLITRQNYRSLLALGFFPLGLFLFMGYQQIRFGTPTAFIAGQTGFRRIQGNPLDAIWTEIELLELAPNWIPVTGANLVAFMLTLLIAIPVARRLGIGYGLFMLLGVLIPASTGTLTSMVRYVIVLFPLFVMLGWWGRYRWFHYLLMGLFLLGFLYMATRFAQGIEFVA